MGKRSSGSRDSTVQQNSSKEPGESKEELSPGYCWMPSYDDEDTWGRRQAYSDQTYSCVSPARSCDSVVQQTQTSSKRKPRELKDLGPTLEELKYGRHPVWDREERRHTDNSHATYSGSDNYTPSPEEVAEYHRQSRLQAEAGLQYYNKKNRTNYQLVEALDYVTFLGGGFWVHCNFTAKLQMDAQPQLFFAEMHSSRSKPRQNVINCRLLKEGRTKTTTDGCEECRGERSIVVHPTNGFRRGHPQYKARTLRSRAARI